MSDERTDATVEMATDLEWISREIAGVLEGVVASNEERARNAERHLLRLRFSLARVKELQERVARSGGVFEPARLEVAVSILDTHVMRAEYFCDQVAGQRPKSARQTVARAKAVQPDIAEVPSVSVEQRAA
jgi:hypothetical protein